MSGVAPAHRSRMSVPLTIGCEGCQPYGRRQDLEAAFVAEAKQADLLQVQGVWGFGGGVCLRVAGWQRLDSPAILACAPFPVCCHTMPTSAAPSLQPSLPPPDVYQLFGHPSRGGLRVTLYNGIPDEAVERLVEFMRAFQLEKLEKLSL